MKSFFTIRSNKKIKLSHFPTETKPDYKSQIQYRKKLTHYHDELGDAQTKLYAEGSRAIVVVFQGMDTSGKDGAIKHVMSGVNPQGCQVTSFKEPTATELTHDFFWRVNKALPPRGQIGIFNRSYYEETLITRVHPQLLEAEKLPTGPKSDSKFWKKRYEFIVHQEKYLKAQGYEIIKIFLHISKDEQKRRLLDRFNNPKKIWKLSKSDLVEREFWSEYQKAYEECLGSTVSKHCPWYVVPGDNKENARLAISKILLERIAEMNLKFPQLSENETRKLKKYRALLK